MNFEMWKELKEALPSMAYGMQVNCTEAGFVALSDIKKKMKEIERRTLPERVAEILEKADMCIVFSRFNDLGLQTISYAGWMRTEIAKALRTGDLTEISKWVKR